MVAMDCPPEIDINKVGFVTSRGKNLNARGCRSPGGQPEPPGGSTLSAAFEAARQDGEASSSPDAGPQPAWKAARHRLAWPSSLQARPWSERSSALPPGSGRVRLSNAAGLTGRQRFEGAGKQRDGRSSARPEWGRDRPGRERGGRGDRARRDEPGKQDARLREPKGKQQERRGRKEDLWDLSDMSSPGQLVQHQFNDSEKVLQPFFMAEPGANPEPAPSLPAASARTSRFSKMFATPTDSAQAPESGGAMLDQLFASAGKATSEPPAGSKPAGSMPTEAEMLSKMGVPQPSPIPQPPKEAGDPKQMMRLLQPALFNQQQKPSAQNKPQQPQQHKSQQPQQQKPQPQQQKPQQPQQHKSQPPQPMMAGQPPPIPGIGQVGPPPPLMSGGQTFNPGQFFNMFSGQVGPPISGGQVGPPAPINMAGFPPMQQPPPPQQQQQRRRPQQQQQRPPQQPPPQQPPPQQGAPPQMVFSADQFFSMASQMKPPPK